VDLDARIFIIGVGPGDPDLLTLKAAQTLARCDTILHAGPRDDAGFAIEVVTPLLRPEQRIRGMALVMKRERDGAGVGYERVADALVGEARQGRTAAFLTEGDPMLFGSGSYVVERLRAMAPETSFEVIPGVSAIGASAARLGWPLAQKDDILTICPGTYHADEIGEILDRGGPVCWLKAAKVLPQLVEALRVRGRLEHAAVVECVGCGDERIFRDVEAALREDLSYFTLVLVR
jgi:precorrin-2/cobalt-factor-2 C20-methyltransferase